MKRRKVMTIERGLNNLTLNDDPLVGMIIRLVRMANEDGLKGRRYKKFQQIVLNDPVGRWQLNVNYVTKRKPRKTADENINRDLAAFEAGLQPMFEQSNDGHQN